MNKEKLDNKMIWVLDRVMNQQLKGDFVDLCNKFYEKDRPVIMEIGTYYGATLACFITMQMESGCEDPIIISVDNASYPVKRNENVYKTTIINSLKNIGCSVDNLHLMVADSHTKECEDTVVGILNGRKIDFLFIDGDHSYEGVKKDFEIFSKYVAVGGIIAFHDVYALFNDNKNVGVRNFWNEIKNNYKRDEFTYAITKDDHPIDWSGGIGVLYIEENNATRIQVD